MRMKKGWDVFAPQPFLGNVTWDYMPRYFIAS